MELVALGRTVTDDNPYMDGRIINSEYELTWIERYHGDGEFTITSKDLSILDELPIFTVVNHTDTDHLMIVDSHTMDEDDLGNVAVTIVGSDMLSLLKYRRSWWQYRHGSQYQEGSEDALIESQMDWMDPFFRAGGRPGQLNNHIQYFINNLVGDPNNDPNPYGKERALDGVLVVYDDFDHDSVIPDRDYDPNTSVYDQTIEFLKEFDYGVQTLGYENCYYRIHKGVDRTESVVWSFRKGDITSSFSKISAEDFYTSARLVGRYWCGNYMVDTPPVFNGEVLPLNGYTTRWFVESRTNMDIVGGTGSTSSEIPTQAQYNATYKAKFREQAKSLAKSKTPKADIEIEISKDSGYIYKRDYDIGDLVSVETRTVPKTTVRVIEHVLVKDREGYYGQPTIRVI